MIILIVVGLGQPLNSISISDRLPFLDRSLYVRTHSSCWAGSRNDFASCKSSYHGGVISGTGWEYVT